MSYRNCTRAVECGFKYGLLVFLIPLQPDPCSYGFTGVTFLPTFDSLAGVLCYCMKMISA